MSELNEKYWDKETWKSFVREQIIPLRISAGKLIEFWNQLHDKIHDVPFTEIEKDDALKTILLGGVTSEGEYSARSLALFYKNFFGACILQPKIVVVNLKQGIFPKVAGIVEESTFVKFVKYIHEQTDKILECAYQNSLVESAKETPAVNFDEVIKEPEKVADLIKEFYDGVLKITVNHNQLMLFIFTIRKITRRYLEAAYPELKDADKFENLRAVSGLDKYFEPDVQENEIRKDYCIWYLPESSMGGLVCKLNAIVWYSFEHEDLRNKLEFLFSKVPHSFEDWVERTKRTIGTGIFPDCRGRDDFHAFNINRGLLTTCRIHSYNVSESNISYLKLLDDLSPKIFVGYIRISFSNKNDAYYSSPREELEVQCIPDNMKSGKLSEIVKLLSA